MSRARPVIALGVDQLVAWGVLSYAYPIIAGPMAAELEVSARFMGLGLSLCLLVAGLLAAPVGRAMDRFGPRPMLLVAAVWAPVAVGLLGLATSRASAMVAFVALGIGQALTLYEPAFRTVVEWFDAPRERANALVLITSLGGLASTVFVPLTTLMVEAVGWRRALWLLAGVLVATTAPLRVHVCRSWRAPAARPEPPRPRATFSPSWLASAFSLHGFASTGVAVSVFEALVERGHTHGAAASLIALVGAAQVPGRLLLAPVAARVEARHRLSLLLAIDAVAVVGLVTSTTTTLVGCALAYGACNGMMTLERALVSAHGARASFGARSGRLLSASVLAKAVAPAAVALLRARLSVPALFEVLALVFAAAALCAALAAAPTRGSTAAASRTPPRR